MRTWCLLMCGLAQLACGCDSWKHSERWGFEKTLTKLETDHRDFGEISVSRPLVVRDPARLKFDLGLSAKDLYDEITTQVAGRVGSIDVRDVRGALNLESPGAVSGVPVGRQMAFGIAEALVAAAQAGQLPAGGADAGAGGGTVLLNLFSAALQSAAPTTQPATTQPRPLTPVPTVEANSAAVRAAAIADAMKIFEPTPSVALRPEDKIVGANSAFYRARLFELLSDATAFRAPEGSEFVVLVMTLSISPGIETRQGYLAEVSLQIEQTTPTERGLFSDSSDPQVETAMIASLFPSAVGQNFDLEGLTAVQRGLAGALQAAAPGIAGKVILEAARLNQARLRGAGQLISVASFNRGTDSFGFRVRGEFSPVDLREYVKNRETDLTRPAVFLQDINIPIVAVALLQQPQPKGQARVAVDVRWIPDGNADNDRSGHDHSELRLVEGLHRARAMDRFERQVQSRLAQARPLSRERDWLETVPRSATLSALTGYKQYFPLPDEAFPQEPSKLNPPQVSSCYPLKIRGDRPTALVVRGVNLSGARFTIAGTEAAAEFVSRDGNAALVVVDPRTLNRPDLANQEVTLAAVGPGGASRSITLPLESDTTVTPTSTLKIDRPGGTDTWTLQNQQGGVPQNIFNATTRPAR